MIKKVAVIGGGPAGLMAAEVIRAHGVALDVYDAMPSVGRKFLMAGRGGLNLTHSEPFEKFISHYGNRKQQIEKWLMDFGPDELRAWARGLGIESFVGTSGRVFPVGMKSAVAGVAEAAGRGGRAVSPESQMARLERGSVSEV
jgi:predicted flavoprotein YhiN